MVRSLVVVSLLLPVLVAGCSVSPVRVEPGRAHHGHATGPILVEGMVDGRVPTDTYQPGDLRVCPIAEDDLRLFLSEDGGFHWKRVVGRAPDMRPNSEDFRVTREYDSIDPRSGSWIIWRAEGITWKRIALLPSSPDDPVYRDFGGSAGPDRP